jgi:hypothetical protein
MGENSRRSMKGGFSSMTKNGAFEHRAFSNGVPIGSFASEVGAGEHVLDG